MPNWIPYTGAEQLKPGLLVRFRYNDANRLFSGVIQEDINGTTLSGFRAYHRLLVTGLPNEAPHCFWSMEHHGRNNLVAGGRTRGWAIHTYRRAADARPTLYPAGLEPLEVAKPCRTLPNGLEIEEEENAGDR